MIRLIPFSVKQHSTLLYNWRNQPDVARYMYSQTPITLEEHSAWVDAIESRKTHRQYVVELRGVLVGAVHLSSIDFANRRADLGMYIAEEGARTMGAGALAEILMLDIGFSELSLNKISGEVFATNAAAIRMHKRIGFTEEGCRREHATFEGELVDVHIFSILSEEWVTKRKKLIPLLGKN